MSIKRFYKMVFTISIMVCLISLILISLVMPSLWPIWTVDISNIEANPMLTSPLFEYDYYISEETKQNKPLVEGFYQTHPFIKVCPSCNISYFKSYVSQLNLTDNRVKIRYLILAHFHGSRYKDAFSLA